jgi:hypothetical protein
MKSRAKNLGLAGVILGSSIFSGCVSNADHLYRTGQINAQQHAQMKAAESQRDEGLIFTALGTLMGVNGIKTGNAQNVFAGSAIKDYGIAQASANNTNVYVSNSPQTVAPTSYIPEVTVQMPDWKIVDKMKDTPLVIQREYELPKDKVTATISNSFYDFNRDGSLEYPSEFSGLKSVYLPGEQITISLFSTQNRELEIRVNSKEAKKENGARTSKTFVNLPEGRHVAEFYVDGERLGALDFKVDSRKLEFNKR